MSCNICQTKFSFFVKEVECPGCRFSCCSKCVKYVSNVPEVGTTKVCGRCYNKYKSPVQSSLDKHAMYKDLLPPVEIKNKLDSLENPAKPPIVMYTHNNHWDKFKKDLEPVDQEIVDRLRKLKEEDKKPSLPSVDDIRRRLALLKDEDPDANGTNDRVNIHQVDIRTDQEKADDLIQEYLEQLELSSRNDPASEIEMKLNSLRGVDKSEAARVSYPSNSQDIDDDEDKVTSRLVEKALAEVALGGDSKADDDESIDVDLEAGKRSEDEDEKPTCVMCEQTEDLARCMGCHGDLYCPVCFEDNHDDFEMSKHKLERVKKLSPD